MTYIPASIPSPSHGVWNIGPVPIRAYALMILLGIATAIWLGNKRWIERGGLPNQVGDVAMWAVPFGVVGGRLYHVLTDWSAYFGNGGRGFVASLQIWEGGLGIWGAVALGALGAYIGCARSGLAFAPFADAIAPALVLAQAIGRWGNWFNQELFGRPTDLPWGLTIDVANRPEGYVAYSTFHPTFLYESLSCLIIMGLLLWADRKFTLSHGRVFALYLALYCTARGVIETIRIDEAHTILGIRLNVFTAIIVGLSALLYLVKVNEVAHGREFVVDGKYAVAGTVPAASKSTVIDTTVDPHVADDAQDSSAPDGTDGELTSSQSDQIEKPVKAPSVAVRRKSPVRGRRSKSK
jgi:prolipoprotein diacylglyceryl transferase